MSTKSTYVGPVDLGSSLVSLVLVTDNNGAPTNANAAPTYIVYGVNFDSSTDADGTTHVNNDLAAITGAYGINQTIRATSGFAAGNTYAALVRYDLQDGSDRRQAIHFRVV